MIQIYGSPKSSAGRCFTMLEECGIPYEAMPLDMKIKQHKSPEFLKLNPNGKVPCLVDNDFILWESAAIVHYLAEKYRSEMLGSTTHERGHILQWSFWSMAEAQPPLIDIFIQKVFIPEDKRNLDLIAQREQQVPALFKILNDALEGKKYLVANKFSVADLMTAKVMNITPHLGISVGNYSNLNQWLTEINNRPAWKKFN